MNLQGTKTKENLEKAFAGESMARNKYLYYSSQAKKEGYNKIAQIFEETAHNEMAHAQQFFNKILKFCLYFLISTKYSNISQISVAQQYFHLNTLYSVVIGLYSMYFASFRLMAFTRRFE